MQGEHKNPFIYISTYCNNIYQELLTFVFDFRKTSVQKPLTLNNTSGLFNHHMRRVIQRGEALWKEEKQEGTPSLFVHFVVLVAFEKKKSGTKDEQLNKKTDKIHQKIDWKTKKLSPINVVHAHPLNDSAEVCFQYIVHLFQLCIHIG